MDRAWIQTLKDWLITNPEEFNMYSLTDCLGGYLQQKMLGNRTMMLDHFGTTHLGLTDFQANRMFYMVPIQTGDLWIRQITPVDAIRMLEHFEASGEVVWQAA